MKKEKDSNKRIVFLDSFRKPVANGKLSQEECRRLDYQTLLKEINAFSDSLAENKADAEKEKATFQKLSCDIEKLDVVIYEAVNNHDIAMTVDESGGLELTVGDGIADYDKLCGVISKRTDLIKQKTMKSAILKTTHLIINSEEAMLELFRLQLKEFREDKIFMESLQFHAYEAVRNVAEAEDFSLGYTTDNEMSFGEKVKTFFGSIKEKITFPRKK